jgi:hypothetical protein
MGTYIISRGRYARIEFVGHEGELAGRMEDEMARSRARRGLEDLRLLLERVIADVEGEDLIASQVDNQQALARGVEYRTVRVWPLRFSQRVERRALSRTHVHT